MTEGREQIVRIVIDALNARKADVLEPMVTEDFEMHSAFAALEGGEVYRSAAGLIGLMEEVDATWEGLELRLDRVIDLDEQTVVFYALEGRARASGIPLSEEVAMVWTWRDGKICRSQAYLDRVAALESVGIVENI